MEILIKLKCVHQHATKALLSGHGDINQMDIFTLKLTTPCQGKE